METLLIILGITFAAIFGAKVLWTFFVVIGGVFWKISGFIIFYALVVFGIMTYSNFITH